MSNVAFPLIRSHYSQSTSYRKLINTNLKFCPWSSCPLCIIKASRHVPGGSACTCISVRFIFKYGNERERGGVSPAHGGGQPQSRAEQSRARVSLPADLSVQCHIPTHAMHTKTTTRSRLQSSSNRRRSLAAGDGGDAGNLTLHYIIRCRSFITHCIQTSALLLKCVNRFPPCKTESVLLSKASRVVIGA